MLVTHVWYVSHPSINLGAHEPYGCFPALFFEEFRIIYRYFFKLDSIKIYEKQGKYNQKQKKKQKKKGSN